MRIFTLIFAAITLMLVGCARHYDAAIVMRDSSLKNLVGERVTLVGVAESRKSGAALRGDGFYVWIDGLLNWPVDYVERKVEVVGVLEDRHDLPVFIQAPGELPVQGIPVPEGTDLQAASRRYVIRDAKWSILR